MADPRHLLGSRAEELVARWLESRGWQLQARRWRSTNGELDLVLLEPGGVLVGVEVRLRRNDRAGSPLESVTQRHLQRLRATLGAYARQYATPATGLRLDLVAVQPSRHSGHWVLRRLAGIDSW